MMASRLIEVQAETTTHQFRSPLNKTSLVSLREESVCPSSSRHQSSPADWGEVKSAMPKVDFGHASVPSFFGEILFEFLDGPGRGSIRHA